MEEKKKRNKKRRRSRLKRQEKTERRRSEKKKIYGVDVIEAGAGDVQLARLAARCQQHRVVLNIRSLA